LTVWAAELSFDGFVFTPDPTIPITQSHQWLVGVEAICLPVLDPMSQFNATPDDGNFFLCVGYKEGGDLFPVEVIGSVVFQFVTMRLGDSEIKPSYWTTPFIMPPLIDFDTTLLTAGGTLSIVKDFASDSITFTGPLGSQSVALSAIDALPGGPYGYTNNTPLRPRGFAHETLLPDQTVGDPSFAEINQVDWFNLIGRQDGVAYDTVALSSGDPGNWWPILALAFDRQSGATSSSLTPWWNFQQRPTRERVQSIIDTTTTFSFQIFTTAKRRRPVMAANPIDIVLMPAPNLIALIWESMPTALTLRTSRDDGHTWADTEVETTTAANSPSVQVLSADLIVCYYDGIRIVTQRSRDLALTWSEPMPMAITGTNPRLVISPETGAFFFFYCASSNLLLQRSFDQGATLADATPITVALVVTPQDFGAVLAADRALVVSYTSLGQILSRKSLDFGLTWMDA